MRKSTLFVSTVLTMFMLVTMFGVVSAYQQNKSTSDVTVEPDVQQVATVEPTPTQSAMPAVVSPEQATTIAVDFMADTDVYSVEVVEYEGKPAFLVTFSSGQLVYVSPAGEILSISEVEPVVVMAPPPPKKNNNNNNNGGSSNNGGSHEDHEEHDD